MKHVWLAPIAIALGSTSSAQTIPSGCDCYVTEAPPTGDSTAEIPALGLGFFGATASGDSDPFPATTIAVQGEPLPMAIVAALCPDAATFETVWVDPHGNPVAPNDAHRVSMSSVFTGFEPIDTIVCRPNTTPVPSAGTSSSVTIELVELSLRSVDPIAVTYGGGAETRFWDVFITESGVTSGGSMTVTSGTTGPVISNGTMTMNSLPVDYELKFVEVGGTIPDPPPVPGSLDFMNPTPGNWQYDALAGVPPNNTCANATAATIGSTPFDNSLAMTNGQPLDSAFCSLGFGDNDIHQDVWFQFTAPTSDFYDLSISAATAFDSRMAIYDQSTCPDNPSNVIDCDDDSGPGFLSSMSGVQLTAGSTYLIRCGTYGPFSATSAASLDISIALPPPFNDDCAGAPGITVGSTPFDTTSATDGTGLPLDPLVCDLGVFGDDQIYQDVWFVFGPTSTANYDITIENGASPAFDSRIALYAQSTCPDDPSLVIACDDDSGPGPQAGLFSVALTAGAQYLIRAGSFSASTIEHPAILQVGVSPPPPPPPANDDCLTAASVNVGLTPFDSRGATDGSGLALDPFVCDMSIFGDEQIYQDVWFSFTPPQDGLFEMTLVPNGNPTWNSRMAVYNQPGCPDNPANVIECDDDSGVFQEPAVTASLVASSTYLIRAGSFNPFTIEYPAALSITFLGNPPNNDECFNATAIAGLGTHPFDATNATTSGPDLNGFCDVGQFGDDIVHNDVWFSYTATTSDCIYISTLNLAGYDTRIAVYDSSSCGSLAPFVIACSDDEVQNPQAFPFEAGLDVNLTFGVTYLISVGTFSELTLAGPAALQVALGPQAIFNDGGLQPGAPGCGGFPSPFLSMCNGDGGDQMGCTDCPCNNNAAMGTVGGCANSSSLSTRLDATGDLSVSLPPGDTTDLRLSLSGAPASAFCVMLSGGALAPQNMGNPCFGLDSGVQSSDRDGLRCAVSGGQGLLRHGGRSADASGQVMNSSGPSRVWGGEATPNVGLAVQAGFAAGQTRYFQVTHRDDPLLGCMRGLNTSQAIEVTWTP